MLFRIYSLLWICFILSSVELYSIEHNCNTEHTNPEDNSNQLISIDNITIPRTIYNKALICASITYSLARVCHQLNLSIEKINNTTSVHSFIKEVIEGKIIQIERSIFLLEEQYKKPLFELAKSMNISEEETYHLLVILFKKLQDKKTYTAVKELALYTAKIALVFASRLKLDLYQESILPSDAPHFSWFGRHLIPYEICCHADQIVYEAFGKEYLKQFQNTASKFLMLKEKSISK